MFYENNIPNETYRELNKNAKINTFFGKAYVGECVRLISDYYETTTLPTQDGWEQYYKDTQGFDCLRNVYAELQKRLPNLDEATIKHYIYFRVIGQTWNGFAHELATIEELNYAFPDAYFKKTSFEVDHDYCIDAEMYFNNTLMLGLQIKPLSYKAMSSAYQLRAKEQHRQKNEQYKEKYAPYVYVYYGTEGIDDREQLFNQINTFLHYANSKT
jgi:hypothetical protein